MGFRELLMDWYRSTEGPGKKLGARLWTRDGWEGLFFVLQTLLAHVNRLHTFGIVHIVHPTILYDTVLCKCIPIFISCALSDIYKVCMCVFKLV